MSRRELLDDALELVQDRMGLRPPQAEALREFCDMLKRLPRPLGECNAEVLRQHMTTGDFEHPHHPTFTLALATGVGKTRLAGALMALLWLSGEAQTFLFLAPSRAVLKRLRSAFSPAFREYIFIEPNLVPEPNLILSDQLEDPIATGRREDLFAKGPTVYLLTHQLISTSRRFLERADEFSAESPAAHLLSRRDLVVISDEAHHVDPDPAGAAAWATAIRGLQPQVHIGLTATPRRVPGENLLYEYSLREALRQGLYTKRAEILAHTFDDDTSDEEADEATIRFALSRLAAKTAAAQSASGPAPFPNVKPVLVFFATDTAHATGVAKSLIEDFGVPEREVLLTHSKKTKTVDETELLAGIEDPNNPVRVVVNVMELVEGWDVTNVYVIAPLRQMASFQFGVQAMGRGLRLPAGRRTKVSELDTLDVLCLGRKAFEDIVREETEWSGRTPDSTQVIPVGGWDRPKLASVALAASTTREVEVVVVDLELVPQELELTLGPAAFASVREIIIQKLRVAAARARVEAAEGSVAFERGAFLDAVASAVIRLLARYLSDDVHFDDVRGVVEQWLDETKPGSDSVEFRPSEVAKAMAKALKDSASKATSEYTDTGRRRGTTFPSFTIMVDVPQPDDGTPATAPPKASFEPVGLKDQFRLRHPYVGWSIGLHDVYAFDSWPEAKVAKLIDRSGAAWWVRNQPRRFKVETPAGMFNPDFMIALTWSAATKEILVLEVKADVFWAPPDGKAQLKAKAARVWIEAQNAAQQGVKWSFGLATESAVDASYSWEELAGRLL